LYSSISSSLFNLTIACFKERTLEPRPRENSSSTRASPNSATFWRVNPRPRVPVFNHLDVWSGYDCFFIISISIQSVTVISAM
jgi:hypothetical protein